MHSQLDMKLKNMMTGYKTSIFVLMVFVTCVFIHQKFTAHLGILKYVGVNIIMSPVMNMLQQGDRMPENYWKKMTIESRADCGGHTAASCADCPQGLA